MATKRSVRDEPATKPERETKRAKGKGKEKEKPKKDDLLDFFGTKTSATGDKAMVHYEKWTPEKADELAQLNLFQDLPAKRVTATSSKPIGGAAKKTLAKMADANIWKAGPENKDDDGDVVYIRELKASDVIALLQEFRSLYNKSKAADTFSFDDMLDDNGYSDEAFDKTIARLGGVDAQKTWQIRLSGPWQHKVKNTLHMNNFGFRWIHKSETLSHAILDYIHDKIAYRYGWGEEDAEKDPDNVDAAEVKRWMEDNNNPIYREFAEEIVGFSFNNELVGQSEWSISDYWEAVQYLTKTVKKGGKPQYLYEVVDPSGVPVSRDEKTGLFNIRGLGASVQLHKKLAIKDIVDGFDRKGVKITGFSSPNLGTKAIQNADIKQPKEGKTTRISKKVFLNGLEYQHGGETIAVPDNKVFATVYTRSVQNNPKDISDFVYAVMGETNAADKIIEKAMEEWKQIVSEHTEPTSAGKKSYGLEPIERKRKGLVLKKGKGKETKTE
jgi:hypothetical protein